MSIGGGEYSEVDWAAPVPAVFPSMNLVTDPTMPDLESSALADVDSVQKQLVDEVISSCSFGNYLREPAVRIAGEIWRTWIDRAGSLEIPVDRYVRNLIATAPRSCGAVVSAVYRDAARNGEEGFRPEVGDFLKESRADTGNLFWKLLETKSTPTSKDLFNLFAGKEYEASCILLREAFKNKLPEAKVTQRIKAVYSHAESPDNADKVCFRFARPVLDRDRFDSFSREVRRRILADDKLKKSLLLSEFRKVLQGDPLSHPDTPESIYLADAPVRNRLAVKSIRDGSWKKSEVEELIESKAVKHFAAEIETLLGRKIGHTEETEILVSDKPWAGSRRVAKRCRPLLSTPPSEKTRTATGEISPLRLRNTLLFLQQRSLAHRARFLVKLPTRQRREICERLGDQPFCELVEEAVAQDRGNADKLLGCREGSREWTKENFSTKASSRPEMINLWLEQFDPVEIYRELFKVKGRAKQWQELFVHSVRGYHLHKVSYYTVIRGSDRPVPAKVIEALALYGSDWKCLKTILGSWEKEDVARLLKSRSEWLTRWLQEIGDSLLRGRRNQEFTLFLQRIANANPQVLRKILPDTLSSTCFRILLDYLQNPLEQKYITPRAVRWVLNLRDRDGRMLWQEFLSRLPEGEREPLEHAALASLECIVLASSRERFRFLFDIFPERFAKEALERLDLWTVVRRSFQSPVLGRRIEWRIPRSKLLELIPRLRREFRDKPTLRSAYEVSLALSLPDAGYLAFLAIKRWQNRHDGKGNAFDDLYLTYRLPKRAGGSRIITAPDEKLKRLQRRFLENGFDELPLHPAAHGFRKGHSIVSNAREHTGRNMVVRADISSFFPSTGYGRVLRACRLLADGTFSEGAVRLVAEICCYGGALPTGAPTSPVIGNLVLKSVDAALDTMSRRYGITYTRYADDLTFSGDGEVQKILPFVRKVLADCGFRTDPKKEHIFRKGRRQVVTGLVVNQNAHVPRRIRRRLRAAVHRSQQHKETHWHGKEMDETELMGRLAFLHQAHPEEARVLREKLHGINPVEGEEL